MTEQAIEKNITENTENSDGKTEQFHLRVTRETYEEIKKQAAEFSMSIVFVITHFNLMEISEKVDEINKKLDVMTVAASNAAKQDK